MAAATVVAATTPPRSSTRMPAPFQIEIIVSGLSQLGDDVLSWLQIPFQGHLLLGQLLTGVIRLGERLSMSIVPVLLHKRALSVCRAVFRDLAQPLGLF